MDMTCGLNDPFFILRFVLGNFDVLTEMLAGPRDEYSLPEIDVKFKDSLKGEILRRPVSFTSPLLCVIQGIQSKSEFDAKCIDSYVLETIGGNHRRLALQELLNDQTVEETDKMIATEDRGGIYVKDLDFKLNHDKCIILI